MEPLTRKEEVLRILLKLERAFVNDIIAEMPGKKPAHSTVSTFIKNLNEKGYVDFEDFGSTHRFFPAIPKEQFFQKGLKRVVSDFFGDSHKALASPFARNKN